MFARFWLRPHQAKAAIADLVLAREDTPRLIASNRQLRIPVVMVRGEADCNVSVAASQSLGRAIPGARLVVIPQTGHELMFHRIAEVARVIGEVWESVAECATVYVICLTFSVIRPLLAAAQAVFCLKPVPSYCRCVRL